MLFKLAQVRETVKVMPPPRNSQIEQHGNFITVRELDAVDAVGPDDGQQFFPGHHIKAETPEKVGNQGERKISLSPSLRPPPGKVRTSGRQAPAPVLRKHCHGANLLPGQPTDVQGRHADNGALIFPVDKIVPQLAVKVGQGPGQDAAIPGKLR